LCADTREGLSSATDKVISAIAAWYSQWRVYGRLRQQRCGTFWLEKIEVDRDSAQELWRSVESLLSRSCAVASPLMSIESFNQFFAEKVAEVRENASGEQYSTFTRVRLAFQASVVN
jgi:hypothetical protein